MLSIRSLTEVQAHKPRIPPGVFRCPLVNQMGGKDVK